jgi:dynactin-4
MRNCFQCPSCYNTLTVITGEIPAAATAKPPAGTTAPAPTTMYYLACSTCRWDSREINLTFDRPTGLAGNVCTTIHFVFSDQYTYDKCYCCCC